MEVDSQPGEDRRRDQGPRPEDDSRVVLGHEITPLSLKLMVNGNYAPLVVKNSFPSRARRKP
jgi:hypothetical protein